MYRDILFLFGGGGRMSNFGFSISDLLILNFLITTWERAARTSEGG